MVCRIEIISIPCVSCETDCFVEGLLIGHERVTLRSPAAYNPGHIADVIVQVAWKGEHV